MKNYDLHYLKNILFNVYVILLSEQKNVTEWLKCTKIKLLICFSIWFEQNHAINIKLNLDMKSLRNTRIRKFVNQHFWSCYCLRFEFLRQEKTDTGHGDSSLSLKKSKHIKLALFWNSFQNKINANIFVTKQNVSISRASKFNFKPNLESIFYFNENSFLKWFPKFL